jgi:hypothetical protein
MARRKAARKPTKAIVKAKADRAAARSAGKDPDAVKMPGAPDPLNPPESRRKIGRPTDYDPAFCDSVIALGMEGAGKAEIAYTLGVVRQTLDDWAKRHPRFLDAMSRAREAAAGWWAEQGRKGFLLGKQFNAQAYSFQVRNRFPGEWQERVALTDPDGGVLKVQLVA